MTFYNYLSMPAYRPHCSCYFSINYQIPIMAVDSDTKNISAAARDPIDRMRCKVCDDLHAIQNDSPRTYHPQSGTPAIRPDPDNHAQRYATSSQNSRRQQHACAQQVPWQIMFQMMFQIMFQMMFQMRHPYYEYLIIHFSIPSTFSFNQHRFKPNTPHTNPTPTPHQPRSTCPHQQVQVLPSRIWDPLTHQTAQKAILRRMGAL